MLAVGTRLGDFVTASKTIFEDEDAVVIGINVNGFDAAKLRAIPLVADARESLAAVASGLALAGHQGTSPGYRQRIADLRAEWEARVDDHRTPSGETPDLAQPEVIGILNDVVGGHATVVCAAGSLPGDLLKLWRPEDSKAYHLEYGYSCMGYEIPAGIGIKMAEPEREVVVAIGDGTYLMLNSEIVTAVAEGIRMTVVVFDNHGYQCIKDLAWSVGMPSSATSCGSVTRSGTASPAATSRWTSRSTPSRWAPSALCAHRGGDPGRARRRPRGRPDHRHPRHGLARQARPGLRGLVGRPAGRRRAPETVNAARERYERAWEAAAGAAMRIATAPVNWNNPDVPEYREWLPYPRMMDQFVQAGYDATEWGPGMPEDPVELKEALDARGLTWSAPSSALASVMLTAYR